MIPDVEPDHSVVTPFPQPRGQGLDLQLVGGPDVQLRTSEGGAVDLQPFELALELGEGHHGAKPGAIVAMDGRMAAQQDQHPPQTSALAQPEKTLERVERIRTNRVDPDPDQGALVADDGKVVHREGLEEGVGFDRTHKNPLDAGGEKPPLDLACMGRVSELDPLELESPGASQGIERGQALDQQTRRS